MIPTVEEWYELEVLTIFGWAASSAWYGRKWKTYNECYDEVTAYNTYKKLTANQRIVKKIVTTEVVVQ